MATTFPFDLSDLTNQFFDCIGIEQSDRNYMFTFYQKIIETMIELFGWLAVQLGKLWQFITEGTLSLVQECIEGLSELISNASAWLFARINVFEDIDTPIPDIPLGILDIVIPANKVYRDLVAQYDYTTDQLAVKFAKVVNTIIGFITSAFGWVWDKVESVYSIITEITIDNIAEKIEELITWFAELVAPILGIVNGWIEFLIGLFVEGSEMITSIKNSLIQFVIDVLTGNTPFTDESLDTLDINVHPRIKMIARFIICLLKFIVNMIIYLFSFSWL